jgi:hypothetical protein
VDVTLFFQDINQADESAPYIFKLRFAVDEDIIATILSAGFMFD